MCAIRNRELESHLAEREAMIRVLQRRVEEKEALYQKALMRTSLSTVKRLVMTEHWGGFGNKDYCKPRI